MVTKFGDDRNDGGDTDAERSYKETQGTTKGLKSILTLPGIKIVNLF